MSAPKLRFKEFDGEWKKCLLKDFVTFSKGKGISKADISADGINLCIRYGELYTTYGQVIDKVISKTNIAKSNSVLSKANDVIIPASGETQIDIATASCVLQNDVILSGDLNILSHQENGEWLAYYLSSAKKKDISTLAQGNSVVHLYSSQLKDLKINKPSKEEQTKIASFLSAVDQKISQLSQKHELLRQYKQGMMQKLFSQQIRFKADDGSEFGEWGQNKIGNIVETIFGYPFDSKDMVEDPNGIPLMRGINIGERHIRHSVELDRFFVKDSSNLEKYTVKVNDIVLSMDGSKVGRNSAFVKERDANSLLVQRVCILREKELANIQYIYQWIISNHFHRYVDQVKTSSGIPHISGKQIQDYEIAFPCLEEQTKIANFLSAIDQKIEVVAQQIEQAKTWKKGLLQQMFV
ncbi:restriction endonuclease subunit S [Acinetobacter defluvii]|uniref:restriction endonuclease subunit S n=1 Tax=Acinetobacter defluvii TaxID=1871111 RepID=UPI003AF6282B